LIVGQPVGGEAKYEMLLREVSQQPFPLIGHRCNESRHVDTFL